MDNFVGRKAELHFLETAEKQADSAFIPIYGRRRIGKSELIIHFIRNKPAIYFSGSKAPVSTQLREFLSSAALAFKKPFLASLETRDWKTALQTVVSQWQGDNKGGGKLVIALDEFQWMAEASPELPSVLQLLWDREWKSSGQLFLILCGSYIGFMEREVLGSKSPLFGRRTGQILLKPFSFRESGLFHPDYSLEEKTRAYFLTGGIPLYLNFFSSEKSVEGNIHSCFLDEYAPLYREAEFLLHEELTNVSHCYGILASLASGCNTVKALAESLAFDSRALPYYLQQLLSLGYIRKQFPNNGKPPAARQVRYVIADPLLKFWFTFIYPHSSSIMHLGAKAAFAGIIKPRLAAYYGFCFEELCRSMLPLLYQKDGINSPFIVGAYWSKDCQIDVVGYRNDNLTDIGECKWGKISSLPALSAELEAKIKKFPNERNATIGRHLFTREPLPKAKTGSLRPHNLEDLVEKAVFKGARE